MGTYVFRAVDLTGRHARGEVEAETKQAVADQLSQRGLIPLDVADKRGSVEINFDRFRRVKARDLTVMTRQLATMVSSGVSILRCLAERGERIARAAVPDPGVKQNRQAR